MQNESVSSRRYFDRRIGAETVYVLPGFHHVQSKSETSISTLLGSCVSACIRDKKTKAGGLNHFLLPEKQGDESSSARYGVHAMELLINDLLKLGSKKENLEAKIFGGANVIQTSAANPVGSQNSDFVIDYLRAELISITAKDLGGDFPRRIYFFPDSGKVSVLRVGSVDVGDVVRKEMEMQKKVFSRSKAESVELF